MHTIHVTGDGHGHCWARNDEFCISEDLLSQTGLLVD